MPIAFLAPLFGQAENDKPALSECLFFQVAFAKLILRNDDPASFFLQSAHPFNIGGIPRKFIRKMDYFMAIFLRKSMNGLCKRRRKIVV